MPNVKQYARQTSKPFEPFKEYARLGPTTQIWRITPNRRTLLCNPRPHLFAVVSKDTAQWIARNLQTKKEFKGYARNYILAKRYALDALKSLQT